MFFKSANDILGVSDNLFTKGFLWARCVTNLFLVSSLELESKFKAMVKAWCYHRPSVHGDQVLPDGNACPNLDGEAVTHSSATPGSQSTRLQPPDSQLST